jgi:hypothetical protein
MPPQLLQLLCTALRPLSNRHHPSYYTTHLEAKQFLPRCRRTMASGSAFPHQHTAAQNGTMPATVPKIDERTQADGSWKMHISNFRNTIQEGGEFPPEKGKRQPSRGPSHVEQRVASRQIPLICLIYLSYATTFVKSDTTQTDAEVAYATRTLIVRKLKGLEDFIRESQ